MSTTSDGNSGYTLQAKTKAVVFVQINIKTIDIEASGADACVELYTPLFERYLECRNVGLVYMYLSFGIGQDLVVPNEVLMDEAMCLNILQLAEYKAREKHPNRALKFIPIATFQLASLLRHLYKIDPALIELLRGGGGAGASLREFLRGESGTFTFDSPKFVEAVIQIVRGWDPRLAGNPVVRFDEDVHVCEESLDVLLTAYENFQATTANLNFFFSGRYGDSDIPDTIDPINDRVVRAHWFTEISGDGYKPDLDKIKLFWRDLGEVGATQLGQESSPSIRGMELIAGSEESRPSRGSSVCRRTQQVISGAGLIMSHAAIRNLPPFMSLNHLAVWADDFLLRLLHEMIGNIHIDEMESVALAKFKQYRHPHGIQAKDIEWAKIKYFDALLAGCMMDAIIGQPANRSDMKRIPTEFTQAINEVIEDPQHAERIKIETIRPALQQYAEQRYDEVLFLWQTPEYKGTALHEWAYSKSQDPAHKTQRIDEILEDASAYLELVKLWKVSFSAAIGRLKPIGNLWLFERVQ
jgi:hypothetical protein